MSYVYLRLPDVVYSATGPRTSPRTGQSTAVRLLVQPCFARLASLRRRSHTNIALFTVLHWDGKIYTEQQRLVPAGTTTCDYG